MTEGKRTDDGLEVFGDKVLVAYVDGEDDHAPVAAIERAMVQDPVLRARIDALRAQGPVLGAALATLSPPAAPRWPEAPAPLPREAANRNFGPLAAVAAALVVLALGFGAGRFTVPEATAPAMGWKMQVAVYQGLYGPETLSGADADPERRAADIARVGAALGRSFDIATLEAPGGLGYARAQVLDLDGRPLAQIALLDGGDTPVALCVLRSATPSDTDVAAETLRGLAAASWSSGGYDYLLIGGKDAGRIEELARTYRATI